MEMSTSQFLKYVRELAENKLGKDVVKNDLSNGYIAFVIVTIGSFIISYIKRK